ncbi:hypothetical protein M4R23_08940 [Acidovorax sp. GBBC 3332]|nr:MULTISPECIES: hypothetical protein [unclassified Acidovorax]MDA8449808.1 hypothetical protein [Acidovorax sp. GBBC 3297]MDA8459253.1 hypothetical protein [Acidovorax sp. GBBC 3333]MDA8464290.1 hypothetical protein [Acidovorax sp. GBBC 3332]MDA8469500.1 hypothetical protein [Acidovorax sp. GBBC 3299]
MRVRCRSCGAVASLDALVDDDAAAEALRLAFGLSPLGPLLTRYLGLFRPQKNVLTWPRVASLLGELLPSIQSGRVERDGKVFDASPEAWATALEKVVAARDAGALKVPLRTHGYLLEVVIGEAARHQVRSAVMPADADTRRPATSMSLSAQGMAALAARRSNANAGE